MALAFGFFLASSWLLASSNSKRGLCVCVWTSTSPKVWWAGQRVCVWGGVDCWSRCTLRHCRPAVCFVARSAARSAARYRPLPDRPLTVLVRSGFAYAPHCSESSAVQRITVPSLCFCVFGLLGAYDSSRLMFSPCARRTATVRVVD